MIGAVATGFGTAFSLILAIGSQNAFVLRQGLMREHVLPVILVCTLSDAILITAGVAGMGAAVAAFPVLLEAVMWGGALFLIVYGGLAARRALFPGRLDPAAKGEGSLRGAVATTLALTWLNPHVYLDTVVLLGSVSVPFVEEGEGPAFALGAMSASLVFFLCLGYGARAVAPLFASRAAWRVLDAVVALIMFAIASVLVRGAIENSVLTTALSQWTG
ncbi:MAG: LysE/ArgO family amino acid transporter [Pseudomonadota bacterium]